MNKTIVAIIMGIALISLASAMYAGECLEVDLSELERLDNVTYDVVGNSSNLKGLTIELDGTIANVCTVLNYKPDSFTLIFIDDSTKEIITEYSTDKIIKYVDKEVLVEVPNYIDREVIKEVEIIKEVPGETEIITKVPLWVYFSILAICFLACLAIYLYYRKYIKSNSSQEELQGEEE